MIMDRCIHGIKNRKDCVYCGTMPLEHEIQTLRAKVASAEVLVEAMSDIAYGMYSKANNNTVIKDTTVSRFADEIFKVLATYDKQSEVNHDTK